MTRPAPFPGLPGNRADSSRAKLARMSAGTGEDQAAAAPAAPEPTGMVQAGEGLALPRAVRQHTGRRNAAARAAILDLLADVAYGVLWYRLLIGHAPLDLRAARDLAAHLLAAGASGLADAAQPSRPGEGG